MERSYYYLPLTPRVSLPPLLPSSIHQSILHVDGENFIDIQNGLENL